MAAANRSARKVGLLVEARGRPDVLHRPLAGRGDRRTFAVGNGTASGSLSELHGVRSEMARFRRQGTADYAHTTSSTQSTSDTSL